MNVYDFFTKINHLYIDLNPSANKKLVVKDNYGWKYNDIDKRQEIVPIVVYPQQGENLLSIDLLYGPTFMSVLIKQVCKDNNMDILSLCNEELKKFDNESFFTVIKLNDITRYKNSYQWFAVNSYIAYELVAELHKYGKLPKIEILVSIDNSYFYIGSDEGSSPGMLCICIDTNFSVSIGCKSCGWIYTEELQKSPQEILLNTMEMLNEGTLSIA